MKKITIGGAGPTGLAAGLFLAQKGLSPEIIEKKETTSKYSKALGVNARTLTLLEGTGATEAFLKNGWKLRKMNIWKNDKKVFQGDLSARGGKYPFLLIQAQSESEEIMEKLLNDKGIQVQRGKEITEVKPENDAVELAIKNADPIKTDYYFAAEGAHSVARHSLDLSFDGNEIKDAWNLVDLYLEMPLAENEGHVFMLDDGAFLLLPIKDGLWRAISNTENLLERLPKGSKAGEVVWESDFSVHHRMIQNFQYQNIFFGGDAAHVHSPVGGRGMNLGIEDAYVFAELLKRGELNRYNQLRRPRVKKLIKKVERMTDLVQGQSLFAKSIRKALPLIGKLPFTNKALAKFALGLDHELGL